MNTHTLSDIQKLLDPSSLNLPASPRVVRIEVQEGEDWSGDPSLFIWVLLADDTPDEEHTWQKVKPIDRIIHDTLRQSGETRFPYIRFRTESEHRELTQG